MTISVSPATITVGQTATLTWSSSNATSCTASNAWIGSQATSGSQSVSPSSAGTYTYTLACTGAGGNASNSATLTVNAATPTPTVNIAVSPSTITVGQSSTLTWSSTNSTSCTASNAWSGSQATAGSQSVSPSAAGTYVYTLTCSGAGGSGSDSATLTVNAATSLAPPLVITTKTLPPATAGSPYSLTLQASGEGPFSWDGSTIAPPTADNMSNNLTIGTNSGVLSGTPYYSGTQPIFVTVNGANGGQGVQMELPVGGVGSSQNIIANQPPALQGQNYSYEFRATWDNDPRFSSCGNSTTVFGSLPPRGMSWNTLTHILGGAPTFAGHFTFTFFTNPGGSGCGPEPTNSKTVTLVVNPAANPSSPPGSSNWTRQGASPVLTPGGPGWDGFFIGAPSVVKVDAIYYMFYEGQSDSSYRRAIGLATSSDGLNWTKYANNPVLQVGPAGAWDAGGVRYPVVHHDGSQFRMLYQGGGNGGSRIGLATSPDGTTWSKHASNPVITGEGFLSYFAPGALIFNGTQFVLFYSSDDTVGRMTSADAITWMDTGTVFNSGGTSRPAAILDGSTYRMWFTHTRALGSGFQNPNSVFSTSIGYADSPDGITWTQHGIAVFTAGAEHAWDRPGVGMPAVVKDGANFRMWYVGGRSNVPAANAFVEGSIGYAVIP